MKQNEWQPLSNLFTRWPILYTSLPAFQFHTACSIIIFPKSNFTGDFANKAMIKFYHRGYYEHK